MHVGDGMDGPRIGRFEVDSLHAEIEGAGIVAAFLKTERGHAEDGVPALFIAGEGAHGLKRPVAQIELAAREETSAMAVLQRQQVARRILRDAAEG